MVSNIKNYTHLDYSLKNENLEFKTTMLNNSQVKINVNTEQDYRTLTKLMNESKQQWHSYENKQSRPIRVMVRNLHPSCDTVEIKN